MESMDYNYFSNSAHQHFSYPNYGADAGLFSNSGANDLGGGQNVRTARSRPENHTHGYGVGHGHCTRRECLSLGLIRLHLRRSSGWKHRAYTFTHISIPTSTATVDAPEWLGGQRYRNGRERYAADKTQQQRREGQHDTCAVAAESTEPSSVRLDLEHPAGGMSPRLTDTRCRQRAFRERKEKHVRDLEAKLNLLTTTTSSLQSDNERLKLMLQRAQTENEILRATASSSPTANHPPSFVDDPSLLPASRPVKATGAQNSNNSPFDSTRLANGLLSTEPSSLHKHGTSSPGEGHLLSASATWDLLQSHPLYLSGAVDIGEVCERLKKMARCDGMGPMFEEEEVRKVIDEVGRSGGDELI